MIKGESYAWWLVVLSGQIYVIGCLKKGQYGSRSTKWPFKQRI